MARGIKDKVAILGMGCSRFGERWESGAEELMVEAYEEALLDAGIDGSQLDAAWFSTHYEEINVGKGGLPLATALRLPNIAVTRVENFCASGSEAFRGAVYAVASGACDIALALGVAAAFMIDGRLDFLLGDAGFFGHSQEWDEQQREEEDRAAKEQQAPECKEAVAKGVAATELHRREARLWE